MRTPIVLPVVSAALTAIIGIGAIAFGLLLAALGMTGIGRLELPGVGPILGLTVVASELFGLVAIGAAAGTLRVAPWAITVSAVIGGIGSLGALIALASAGPSAPIVLGLALCLGGLAAALALAVVSGAPGPVRPAA